MKSIIENKRSGEIEMTTELDLSEKIDNASSFIYGTAVIREKDVKEFIKKVQNIIKRKKVMMGDNQVSSWYAKERLQEIINEIRELAGDNLK